MGKIVINKDKTKQDKAIQDKARRQDKTRPDKAGQSKTRQDKTRQDKTRQGRPNQVNTGPDNKTRQKTLNVLQHNAKRRQYTTKKNSTT